MDIEKLRHLHQLKDEGGVLWHYPMSIKFLKLH